MADFWGLAGYTQAFGGVFVRSYTWGGLGGVTSWLQSLASPGFHWGNPDFNRFQNSRMF